MASFPHILNGQNQYKLKIYFSRFADICDKENCKRLNIRLTPPVGQYHRWGEKFPRFEYRLFPIYVVSSSVLSMISEDFVLLPAACVKSAANWFFRLHPAKLIRTAIGKTEHKIFFIVDFPLAVFYNHVF